MYCLNNKKARIINVNCRRHTYYSVLEESLLQNNNLLNKKDTTG